MMQIPKTTSSTTVVDTSCQHNTFAFKNNIFLNLALITIMIKWAKNSSILQYIATGTMEFIPKLLAAAN